MSKANPKKAVNALFPLPIKAGKGLVVHPMTLGMYAALEHIDSPLVTGKDAKDTLELIPSLYLLTHDPIEVFRGNILELAMAWANTVPVKTMEMIRRAAYRQLNTVFDVIPEVGDDSKTQKKTTDSSRTLPRSPRKPSTGAMRSSCGASRSRQSASSIGAKD